MRIGYLIPEFPGQTHSFFWRERASLLDLGVEPELVSTRPPPPKIITHAWSEEAMRQTTYLTPLGVGSLTASAWELARGLPSGGAGLLRTLRHAEGHDSARLRARLVGLVLVGARLAALARSRKWSHIHVHSCSDAAHVALFAHLLSGVPYSLTLHGPLRDYGENQGEKWRHAAFAVIITKKLMAEVQTQLAGKLPPVVEIAPMGVDSSSYVRSGVYEPWDGNGELRIFSCGRLNVCKGHADLIRAIGLLRERGLPAKLTIAGEDEAGGTTYRPVLQNLIAELGLEKAVTLLGAVSDGRVRAELDQTHLFALASLEEPLGVAIMEAMAMGTPVVVTRAGGVEELVRDEIDGLFVPPQDPPALAACLASLALDPARAKRLAGAGREQIRTAFDSARSAQVLAHLIGA